MDPRIVVTGMMIYRLTNTFLKKYLVHNRMRKMERMRSGWTENRIEDVVN